MLHRIAVIITCLMLTLLSTRVAGREVDHYMAWGVDLEDMGPVVDQYIREHLAQGLEQVNRNKYQRIIAGKRSQYQKTFIPEKYFSCTNIATQVMNAAFYAPTYQKIEAFLDSGEGIDRYPRRPTSTDKRERRQLSQLPEHGYMTNMEYLRNSMIGSSPFFVPLSRVVNVHGIYSGADKFGHFTSFGARYLKQFRNLVLSGQGYEDAFLRVLEIGYRSERSVVGMTFTGVFSRGDLEANFQGMRFAASLCKDESPVRLTFDGQRWRIKNLEHFTIEPYVNPGWDESYNTSIFSAAKWRKYVTPVFDQRDQCQSLHSTWLKEQRSEYLYFTDTSINQQLEDRWLPRYFPGFNPAEHSLEYYCGMPEYYPVQDAGDPERLLREHRPSTPRPPLL